MRNFKPEYLLALARFAIFLLLGATALSYVLVPNMIEASVAALQTDHLAAALSIFKVVALLAVLSYVSAYLWPSIASASYAIWTVLLAVYLLPSLLTVTSGALLGIQVSIGLALASISIGATTAGAATRNQRDAKQESHDPFYFAQFDLQSIVLALVSLDATLALLFRGHAFSWEAVSLTLLAVLAFSQSKQTLIGYSRRPDNRVVYHDRKTSGHNWYVIYTAHYYDLRKYLTVSVVVLVVLLIAATLFRTNVQANVAIALALLNIGLHGWTLFAYRPARTLGGSDTLPVCGRARGLRR